MSIPFFNFFYFFWHLFSPPLHTVSFTAEPQDDVWTTRAAWIHFRQLHGQRRRRDLNPRAAINDLLPFQGSPFGQLGYFSITARNHKINYYVYWTERVGFEPTRPCGQTVFKTASLWPLRYLSIYLIFLSLSATLIILPQNISIVNNYFPFCPSFSKLSAKTQIIERITLKIPLRYWGLPVSWS